MNPSIKKLAAVADKPVRHIIGLMSGTSLDGLDVALCKLQGSGPDTRVELLEFDTHPYSLKLKNRLKEISSKPKVSLEEVCLMHTKLGEVHGQMILDSLKSWDNQTADIDCIASHGQTIFHAPQTQHKQADIPNTTLQIGDADHLAMKTGILTISDFRQKHTAAGGEGAPMVSLVDRILFEDKEEDRVLLNIGGIANFTWLPSAESEAAGIITTDTGPGNTLIDAVAQEFFSKEFDEDSRIAREGSVDNRVLAALKKHEYFQQSMPRTTGPEVFNLPWVRKVLNQNKLPMPDPVDLMATLTRFSAETIVEAMQEIPSFNSSTVIYTSGGGMHNPLLMEWIRELLPGFRVSSFKEIGFDPDAKEAVLFAVLANEMLAGEGFVMDSNSADGSKINFGKISFPI